MKASGTNPADRRANAWLSVGALSLGLLSLGRFDLISELSGSMMVMSQAASWAAVLGTLIVWTVRNRPERVLVPVRV